MPFLERDDQGNIIRLHREKTEAGYEYQPYDSGEVREFLEDSDPLLQRKRELTETDFQLIRGVEDLIQVLLDKSVLTEDDLPHPVRVLLQRRQSARGMMKDLMDSLGGGLP